jgi:hypothetical protein
MLVHLVPDVIGVAGKDARVTPDLVLVCVDAAPGMSARRRARVVRRANRRLRWADKGGMAARWCRLTERSYRAGSAARVMREVTRGAYAIALPTLLHEAIEVARLRLVEREPIPDVSATAAATGSRGPQQESPAQVRDSATRVAEFADAIRLIGISSHPLACYVEARKSGC